MVDYHALRALAAVIENQSFELASQEIGISQPAVTQRIQSFESYLGERLLIRKLPYKASKAGEMYLSLLRKVTILEGEVEDSEEKMPVVKLAINRDSLDLYFLKVLSDPKISSMITMQIIADDQDNTLKYLKNGQVDLCISSVEKPLQNHLSLKIGEMKYSLVCASTFYKKYFQDGVNRKSLSFAPLVIFDRHDKAQHSYLKSNYNINLLSQANLMPSLASFKHAIIGGFGYGLMPIIDIQRELRKKQLIQMNPQKDFNISLYLHQWEYQRDHIKLLCEKIMKSAEMLRINP